MKPAKKLLLEELTATLTPHVGLAPGTKLPKGIAKTVQHLTDQILRLRVKQEKQRTVVPTKVDRQLLTEQLAGLLDAHLHDSPEQEREEPVTRVISKTAGQLADKLTKLRKLPAPTEVEALTETKVRRPRTARTATNTQA
ncbi:hypothetical protein [Hymenobacter swuensis]|uniref:Uncharacterized protein n=1 Tax=Hymenobacter swuensis DY53 TaxID=1227739 RepID=W8F1V7_9BACT|nr:hypothetical protein [Hymenobacter swuensis]AHJ99389.1 hypothetical protein Hsw_3794 [Hymenobacter swuensis DY53]